MANGELELRNIVWGDVFPFLRLFRTFKLAIRPTRLLLGLAAVVAVCVVGWVLDGIWLRAGHGVLVDPLTAESEIRAYATLSAADYQDWARLAEGARELTTRTAGDLPPAHGPFRALLGYEMRCFAEAVRGVCTLDWGYSASPDRPSLVGGIFRAGTGVLWLMTQRSLYFVIYGLLHFAIFAFFGGAIARHVALEVAREETLSLKDAVNIARQKFIGLFLAPIVPIGMLLGIGIVTLVASLVGAIPVVGEILAGVLWGLALLAGFAMAMILLAVVLGAHLMWPTIAVEGSDAFDGVSHAVGYVAARPWKVAFYTLLLLLYGGVCFVLVRLIAMLTLKLTHVFADAGMSWLGLFSSARTEGLTKLDAMWHMPDWSGLSLLPTADTPFWGEFFRGDLPWHENVGAALIMIWVAFVLAAVGGFIVSFFFTGSTQMFFLLRRDVDAVDYNEIYTEESEATGAAETSGAAEAPAGEATASSIATEPPPGDPPSQPPA